MTPVRRAASALVTLWAVAVAPAAAQEGLDALCSPATGGAAECRLAVAAVRVIQPRIGVALWGGSPVPGSASTLGMRRPSSPRVSVSGRVTLAPTTLPPLTDRTTDDARTAWLTGLSAGAAVGLLDGFSPLPTVGGVLSLDALAAVSYVPLPADKGFTDGAAWGWQVGVRLGALRESFTLPGVSVAASYARSSDVAFGDPDGTTDGFWRGAITDLNATLTAGKQVGGLGVTAGVAWDRYGGDVRVGYRPGPLSVRVVEDASGDTRRWAGFLGATWTHLVFHAAAELGWQAAPVPDGMPAGVAIDPAGWWAGASFRVSI